MSEKTHLQVEGMTCTNCALGVSRFLEKQGLKEVSVNFSTGDVVFEAITPVDMDVVKSGISGLGYRVVEETGDLTAPVSDTGFTLERKFFFCLIFTIPLLLHMFFPGSIFHNAWLQLILCLPVMAVGLIYFGKSAFSSLKTGVPNMDVLIITGSLAAFGYSVAGMIMYLGTPEIHKYLFFETTATIITLVLLGNLIEKRSVKQTTSAIRELAALQPATAQRITIGPDMQENVNEVKPSVLKKGEPVLITTGAVVPVDGTIYWGNANLDEAALTGESLPVEKGVGDTVLAGSVLMNGTIKVITEKPGGQTLLSDIIQLVKQAQMARPAIQKLGDKISAWFVPAVILVAVVTFIAGYFIFSLPVTTALMSGVAVLVISCPCAMGLATPTAVAVGLGKAAKNGILIKGGDTLELFEGIKTVALDKTGTLTTGEFTLSAFRVQTGFNEPEVINAVVSLEQHSGHPLAKSVLNALGPKATGWVSFENVNEIKGMGLEATDNNGKRWIIGSYRAHEHLLPEKGHTIYVSCDNTLVAHLDLKDRIRPGAPELVQDLKSMGIDVVMISGDNDARCMEVAAETGINRVHSNMLPDQKTKIIAELKSHGKVIMVGDGINDAPSLTAADIGISFGQATKIAMNSAQVIITDTRDLRKIAATIRLGKVTLSTIRQNLFWAFFYNVVAIPVAAIGMLSPMVAALSMAFSDVIVIGNSLRLKLFRN